MPRAGVHKYIIMQELHHQFASGDVIYTERAGENARPDLNIWIESMSDYFRTAYRRAREKVGEAAWSRLSNQEQAEAVTRELEALAAERHERPGDDAGNKNDPDP